MTKITWATTSWNPITGCTPVSEGCEHCYAQVMARRLQAMGVRGYEDGFRPTFHRDRVIDPMHWKKKPRTVFVCSMGDFFNVEVSDEYRDLAMASMKAAIEIGNPLTFLLLTKRPVLAARYLEKVPWWPTWRGCRRFWLGVTAETQEWWDHRVELLLETPAVNRWVNIGPMLERIAVEKHVRHLDWVAIEGESGPGARHMEEDWARDVIQQCDVADVPVHLKQFSGQRPEKCPELDGHRYTAMPPF